MLATLAAIACGGGAPTVATPPPPPPPTGPTLTLVNFPASPLQPGEERQLGVDARDSTGAALIGLSYTWQSSDPSVATVQFGKVVARAPGTTLISASGGGASTDARALEVANPVPVSIVLSPDSLLLRTGTSQALTATVEGVDGVILVPTIQWSSGNPAVAVVDAGGDVTAVAPGVTTVSATTGSLTATVRVVVADRILNLAIPLVQLIQVAQSKQGDLAMVAGKPTGVRLYPTANLPGTSRVVIRVLALDGGAVVHSTDLLSGELPVVADPTDPFQGVVVPLPDWLDLSTVAVRAVIDPDDGVPETDETDNVAPLEGGDLMAELVVTAPLKVRLIPIAPPRDPPLQPREISLQEAEAFLAFAATLLPVPAIEVSLGESAITPTDWSQTAPVLNYIESRRISDGFDGLYIGVMFPGLAIGPNNSSGVAYLGGNAAVSAANPYTFAHEIGHNLSLEHPPGCGIEGPGNLAYPYPFGTIGIPGWNGVSGEVQSAFKYDIMSYCGTNTTTDRWISDYHYGGVMDYLLASQAPSTLRADDAGRVRVRVAGGVSDRGLVLDPPVLLGDGVGQSADAGDVLVELLAIDGGVLATWRLAARSISDATASAIGFAGIVPVDPAHWERTEWLRVTVAGRVGTVPIEAN